MIAFISSKIPSSLGNNHVLVENTHSEFPGTGLKVNSVIYLDKVATLEKALIFGELGKLGPLLIQEVNRKLNSVFKI